MTSSGSARENQEAQRCNRIERLGGRGPPEAIPERLLLPVLQGLPATQPEGPLVNDTLDARAVQGPPGLAWCRAWTVQVDAAITDWTRQLGADRGMAVVALGSYARRELCPGSDVDLLLLHSGWARADLSDLVQRLCYPLWDAGLQVGHAVRTPSQAVKAAGEGIDAATALTDRRLVAGDRGLLDELSSRAVRWSRRNAGRLLADLTIADRRRWAKAGWRPGMLEPQLKNGAGGLRDLQGLRWAAACLLGDVGLDPLVSAHYLGAGDRRELAAAGDILLSARCALHLARHASRRPPGNELDRLRLDVQDEVAARMGISDGGELLRKVGLATRTIFYLHERTWPQLLDDARGGRRWLRASPGPSRAASPSESLGEGLWLRDGAVALDEELTIAGEPGVVLRTLAAAGQRGVWLQRPTVERLRREIADAGTLEWDDGARTSLLELLRCGATALPALSDADHLGVLPAYLPEWNRVRGRPQRNPFHLYDLDTHLYQTIAELVGIGRGALGDHQVALYEGLESVDTLLLSALLHDVGKAWPGDHSVVGARLAREWVPFMGFERIDGERVARLVRHHLLLPNVATRRDLDDESELKAVAATVCDVETLDGLYLLSLADARATGPSAHSPWKDGLLGELHRRVRQILLNASEPAFPGAAAVAATVRERAPDRRAEALLSSVDSRYLITAGVEQVLAHARLVHPVPAPGQLRAAARSGPAEGTVTITVVAGDRRGLMAMCAGVLAAHGLTVLDARAFTTEGGLALDWFVVRPGGGLEGGPDWSEVENDLRRAAAGEWDVDTAVAAREARRDARPRPLAAPVPIEVSFDLRDGLSRIEVHGPDTPGLLYRLAHVLAEAKADVLGARVATLGPEVRDVFFVRLDPSPEARSALARALRDAATPRT